MKCPRCKSVELLPTMIEEYLPAMGCTACHGSLVSLLYYRHWAETQKPGTEAAATGAAVETSDTTTAITCPKCSRIMTKYRMTGGVANRVDVCAGCDEAWLDSGEWELLESLQLSLKVTSIFSDAWQRRIRQESSEETRRSILVRLLGDTGARKVEEFREWLASQKHKPQIMTYLYRR
jgi:Zn-finger nucleic acid-binding protein